jgi:hypothetical protein
VEPFRGVQRPGESLASRSISAKSVLVRDAMKRATWASACSRVVHSWPIQTRRTGLDFVSKMGLEGGLIVQRGGHAPAFVAGVLALIGMAIVVVGRRAVGGDPFGVWGISMLLGVLGINGVTAIGGVALARHSQNRTPTCE